MDIKAQTYKLIDDLKAVCHNYGMGNDGNEYKVITQIFLYKFLNDKFGYEIKKKDSRIASAEKWETAYSELPEDDRLDLLDSLSPDIPRLYPEHIRFDERECVAFGKGDKERIVYFDARTKIHLQNYLQSRTDSEPALFVSLRSPHRRLTIGGIELRLRELGKRLDIPKVHPHKFRRTLATMAIDKGMPIEQLQHLLGHQRIDTTMHYAMVKQSNVKLAHKKYIG